MPILIILLVLLLAIIFGGMSRPINSRKKPPPTRIEYHILTEQPRPSSTLPIRPNPLPVVTPSPRPVDPELGQAWDAYGQTIDRIDQELGL